MLTFIQDTCLCQNQCNMQLMASTERHSLLPIYLDITFPKLPCARMHLSSHCTRTAICFRVRSMSVYDMIFPLRCQ